MMSCQVSEKWNIGPVTAQASMIAIAVINDHAEPSTPDDCRAKTWNASRIRQKMVSDSGGGPLGFERPLLLLLVITVLFVIRLPITCMEGLIKRSPTTPYAAID